MPGVGGAEVTPQAWTGDSPYFRNTLLKVAVAGDVVSILDLTLPLPRGGSVLHQPIWRTGWGPAERRAPLLLDLIGMTGIQL